MSDYYTRTTDGDYQVTFHTEDCEQYKAVEKFCRQMIGHLKPNEPKYELRPTAKWTNVNDFENMYIGECSNCKDTVWIYKDDKRRWKYCPNCGAKMDEVEDE